MSQTTCDLLLPTGKAIHSRRSPLWGPRSAIASGPGGRPVKSIRRSARRGHSGGVQRLSINPPTRPPDHSHTPSLPHSPTQSSLLPCLPSCLPPSPPPLPHSLTHQRGPDSRGGGRKAGRQGCGLSGRAEGRRRGRAGGRSPRGGLALSKGQPHTQCKM